MSEESRSRLFGSVCPTQSAIPRCPENGECTTSPVPRRLMNAPSRATLSPRGERVFIFMHRGEPEDHAIFARNDVSWFLGVREPRGMSDCHEDGSPPSKEEGVRGGVARGSTAPNPSLSKEGNYAPFSCTVVSRRITRSSLRLAEGVTCAPRPLVGFSSSRQSETTSSAGN